MPVSDVRQKSANDPQRHEVQPRGSNTQRKSSGSKPIPDREYDFHQQLGKLADLNRIMFAVVTLNMLGATIYKQK